MTQAQPAPARTELSEAEQYAVVQANAVRHREFFDPANPDNFFPGKSYRDLTAADFQSLPREADIVIVSALLTYSSEHYDVVDSIRPTAMTREQFLHVLLREAARRDIVGTVLNNSEYVPPAVANRNVAISRPLDVPPAERNFAAIPAGDAAYRDIATTLLRNPHLEEVEMERDVALQIGFLNGRGSIVIDDDMSALIAGYQAGSNPRFFDGRQPGQPAGPLPLSVGFDRNVTDPEIRSAYCAIVPAITQPGRARGADQNRAVTAGFVMAREDARTGFANNDVRLAFKDVACPSSPLTWNATTMGTASTGIVVEGAVR